MTLLKDGTTGVENGYDYNSAILGRMQSIDDIGTSQDNYAAEAAQRRLAIKQATEQANFNTAAGADQSGNIKMDPSQNKTSGAGYSSGSKGNNFTSFRNAIAGQETGGNGYKRQNKDSGAMGKYQIMPSNLGGKHSGWDYQALGYDINPSQFLASATLQEKIAGYKLKQYYDKYGASGAAVAWYAGPGMVGKAGNGSQGKYPTINAYAASILKRMGL